MSDLLSKPVHVARAVVLNDKATLSRLGRAGGRAAARARRILKMAERQRKEDAEDLLQYEAQRRQILMQLGALQNARQRRDHLLPHEEDNNHAE